MTLFHSGRAEIEELYAAAAAVYKLPAAALLARYRGGNNVKARRLAIYYAATHRGFSEDLIARLTGYDRSTINHHKQTAKEDPELEQLINSLLYWLTVNKERQTDKEREQQLTRLREIARLERRACPNCGWSSTLPMHKVSSRS
jgi:hypothetical protein